MKRITHMSHVFDSSGLPQSLQVAALRSAALEFDKIAHKILLTYCVLGEFLLMQQLGFEKVRCNEMPMNSC